MAFLSDGQLGGLTDSRGSLWNVADAGVPTREFSQNTGGIDPMKVWKTQPAVRKVVEFIARQFAVVPWHLYERVSGTDRRRVSAADHTLARLLANPAPGLSAYRFRSNLITDAALFDRWAFTVAAEDGVPRLVLLPASALGFESNALREVLKVKVNTDGGTTKFDPDTIVFDSGWAAERAGGVSPMQTLANLINELSAGVDYRKGLMANSIASDLYIHRPAGAAWKDGARDRFRDEWHEFRAGGAYSGKAPILEDGMEVKSIPHNAAAKTQDLEARRLSDAQAASAFQVPPELVGALQGTFSNVDAFRQMIYGPVIGPWIESVVGAAQNLVPLFGLDPDRFYIEANVRDRTRGSFLEEAAVSSTAAGAPYMTRNEIRARQNLPALEGGDDLVVPLNVLVGGQASPRDSAPKAIGPRGFRVALKASPVEESPQRDALADAIESHLAARLEAIADTLEGNAKAAGPATLAQLRDMYDLETADAELAAAMLPFIVDLARTAADAVVTQYPVEGAEWDPSVMDAWLAKAAESNATQANAGWLSIIATAVVGKTDWRDNLAALAVDGPATRAGVYSQTAGTEAWSFGGSDAAKWSGLTSKTWQVTSSKPRASHAAMNGETVDLSDTFSNGARWPGDASLDASEKANCTCITVYG